MRIVFLLVSLWGASALADCFPKDDAHKNVMVFELNSIGPASVSRTKFLRMIKRMESTFSAEVKEKLGCDYVINDMWTDPTVNSQAYQQDGKCYVDAFGGLAKWHSVTELGYYAVACHELGHHMGGAPLYPGDVMSDEGEADYWTSLYCMKKLGFTDTQAKAGVENVADVLAELSGESQPSDSTPDPKVVRKTYHPHPNSQCRLDTYLAGLICKADGKMSPNDPRVGACYSYPNDKAGIGDRPRCWFKP